MPLVNFTYTLTAALAAPATDFAYALRLLPLETPRQQLIGLHYDVHEGGAPLEKTDAFGSRLLFGRRQGTGLKLSCQVQGKALIDPAQRETEGNGEFRNPSARTKQGGLLRLFMMRHTASGDALERARFFARAVHEDYQFQLTAPGGRTAEEAMEQNAGAPEDLAHIILALCRMDGISARYCTGFHAEGPAVWVEIWDGLHWNPIDPLTGEDCDPLMVKLAHGRDAADTLPIALEDGCSITNIEMRVQFKSSEKH